MDDDTESPMGDRTSSNSGDGASYTSEPPWFAPHSYLCANAPGRKGGDGVSSSPASVQMKNDGSHDSKPDHFPLPASNSPWQGKFGDHLEGTGNFGRGMVAQASPLGYEINPSPTESEPEQPWDSRLAPFAESASTPVEVSNASNSSFETNARDMQAYGPHAGEIHGRASGALRIAGGDNISAGSGQVEEEEEEESPPEGSFDRNHRLASRRVPSCSQS